MGSYGIITGEDTNMALLPGSFLDHNSVPVLETAAIKGPAPIKIVNSSLDKAGEE